MPDTLTEWYELIKPEIDASADTWGEKLNADLDKIDRALANALVVTTPVEVTDGPWTVQGTDIPIYAPVQPVAGVENIQLLATQGWVDLQIRRVLNTYIPVNSIMLWWGGWGTIPAGWRYCDGTGGAPDLRDRFIIAAGEYVGPQTVGGNKTAFPGEHLHGLSYYIYPGPAAGTPLEVDDGQALYTGGAATLPYFALIYIHKYVEW
jgi:hypothetical protein